jgi:hypothetical protein
MSELQVVEENSAPEELKPEDDPRYFMLSKPIRAGTRTLDKLLIDASTLDGVTYFQLVEEWNRRWPGAVRRFPVKSQDDNWLMLVIAKLNDIPPEDLAKLNFTDLNTLFPRSLAFQFSQSQK